LYNVTTPFKSTAARRKAYTERVEVILEQYDIEK